MSFSGCKLINRCRNIFPVGSFPLLRLLFIFFGKVGVSVDKAFSEISFVSAFFKALFLSFIAKKLPQWERIIIALPLECREKMAVSDRPGNEWKMLKSVLQILCNFLLSFVAVEALFQLSEPQNSVI